MKGTKDLDHWPPLRLPPLKLPLMLTLPLKPASDLHVICGQRTSPRLGDQRAVDHAEVCMQRPECIKVVQSRAMRLPTCEMDLVLGTQSSTQSKPIRRYMMDRCYM